MFDLVRRLTHKDLPTGEPLRTRLLAVTHCAKDWNALQEIADQSKWILFWADSCETALEVLSQQSIPIVICDRDLPGGDWRTVLKRLTLARKCCILLASSVSDEYLWREVVHHQGFDILPKPFELERVKRIVDQARSWGGWTQRESQGPA